jgi:hypothetical protein
LRLKFKNVVRVGVWGVFAVVIASIPIYGIFVVCKQESHARAQQRLQDGTCEDVQPRGAYRCIYASEVCYYYFQDAVSCVKR